MISLFTSVDVLYVGRIRKKAAADENRAARAKYSSGLACGGRQPERKRNGASHKTTSPSIGSSESGATIEEPVSREIRGKLVNGKKKASSPAEIHCSGRYRRLNKAQLLFIQREGTRNWIIRVPTSRPSRQPARTT